MTNEEYKLDLPSGFEKKIIEVLDRGAEALADLIEKHGNDVPVQIGTHKFTVCFSGKSFIDTDTNATIQIGSTFFNSEKGRVLVAIQLSEHELSVIPLLSNVLPFCKVVVSRRVFK